jgi:hypothetical protein
MVVTRRAGQKPFESDLDSTIDAVPDRRGIDSQANRDHVFLSLHLLPNPY